MTEKKNQHFVPKFYLRQFSISENSAQIGLFYLPNQLYKQAVPLKSQAKEDFFYGEDGFIEEKLAELETITAPVWKKIIQTNTIPKKPEDEYYTFFTFCIVLASRTKDAAEQIKEIQNKLFQEIKGYDETMDKKMSAEISLNNPAVSALQATLKKLPIALDLKVKLLINKTPLKFITSDNPVVKYNQFLEQRKHPGGHIGFAAKGLQMFLPISPNQMLCFYDEHIYKIGVRSKNIVELMNKEDIENLNYLQVLNCFEHLYFNHEISESYIRRISGKGLFKRVPEYSTLNEVHRYFDKEGFEHIQYHSHGNNTTINLGLNFITQTKKAKKLGLSNYVVQLRNESIRGRS